MHVAFGPSQGSAIMTMTTDPRSDPASAGRKVIGEQDARQATKTGHIRWVLVISMTLAIIVLAVAWASYWPRMTGDETARPAAAATFNATGDAATR
jgi:hypothetical protein